MANKSIAALPSGQAIGRESGTQLTFPADGQVRVANNAGASYFDLVAEAANTIAVRNSTNAQELRLYKTYTDASNYERLKIGVNGSNYEIRSEAAGTGSQRNLYLTGPFIYANGNMNITGALSVGSSYVGAPAFVGGANGTNPLYLGNASSPSIRMQVSAIPTSDPAVAGQLWSDGGTLKISAG